MNTSQEDLPNDLDVKIKKLSEIKKLSDIWKISNLTIPNYQRPYKWQVKNVKQLLDDIQSNKKKGQSRYRIGTTILHKETTTTTTTTTTNHNIVDGQQRLVTLTLILNILDIKTPLLNSNFEHTISEENIKTNFLFIKDYFNAFSDGEKEVFKTYILENCEFVVLTTQDLSTAFQLFDSQNSRGKALEPYDLLKAYHLREMTNNTAEEKKECVKKWENAIDKQILGHTIGTLLFRIRQWAKGQNAGYFTKDNISEFKGLNIEEYKNFPYLKPYILNNALVSSLNNDIVHQKLGLHHDFPFQITQMILNGKLFFEYVHFYTENFYNIFKMNESNFYAFHKEYCNYAGSHRNGDIYVKDMYQALLLFFVDKFGVKELENMHQKMYQWSYYLRLKLKSVAYTSVDKYIRENNNLFQNIQNIYFPYDITFPKEYKEKEEFKGKGSEIIIKQLLNN